MSILKSQNILFVEKFPYQDGGTPTDKILILLSIDEESALILQAKVTSTQNCPDAYKKHGCCNTNPVLGISHYCFTPYRQIGEKIDGSKFSFEKYTFVYFKDDIFEMKALDYITKLKGNTRLLGKLSNSEFKRFLKCAQGSKTIKIKHKEKVKKLYETIFCTVDKNIAD